MVAKKTGSKQNTETTQTDDRGQASFPYTTRPSGLRKVLSEIPKRPRPPRVNKAFLAAMGLTGTENQSILRVLRAIGLINSNNEPTEQYVAFMREGTGPGVLGQLVRQTYAVLFEAALRPCSEAPENLRNLFNIHSGGGTIDLQIQTFKALCDSSSFDATPSTAALVGLPAGDSSAAGSGVAGRGTVGPAIHIDLHIHLPPGKTSRDYQYIIQDIARYLYGTASEDGEREDNRDR
jgi:hypothetical protein